MSPPHPTTLTSFDDRSKTAPHPLSSYLLTLMTLKRSNLCLSADVTTSHHLLSLARTLGPSIILLKTHYDLITDWDYTPNTGTGYQLARLGRKHGFLIFEDRKLGDIGSTLVRQWTGGSARIVDWAQIVNLNMLGGKTTVEVLKEAEKRWESRVGCEVRTIVSAGEEEEGMEGLTNGVSGEEDPENGLGVMEVEGQGGRKASIVSITTISQSSEPAHSPRLGSLKSKHAEEIVEDEDDTFPGIDPPPVARGLLLLAQMSSEGNLLTAEYTEACIEVAREHSDFAMGFISQENLNAEAGDGFLCMAPGCQMANGGEEDGEGGVKGDGMGQKYNDPRTMIRDRGVDVIIVGRGILNSANPVKEAEKYRKVAWAAYEERVGGK